MATSNAGRHSSAPSGIHSAIGLRSIVASAGMRETLLFTRRLPYSLPTRAREGRGAPWREPIDPHQPPMRCGAARLAPAAAVADFCSFYGISDRADDGARAKARRGRGGCGAAAGAGAGRAPRARRSPCATTGSAISAPLNGVNHLRCGLRAREGRGEPLNSGSRC